MDNERIREICLALPHARETLNWGHVLVYWVGDREIGGKMFAMTNADGMGTASSGSTAGRSAITSCWRTKASSRAAPGQSLLGRAGAVGRAQAARD